MGPDYSNDMRIIQRYESNIRKHGVEYGETHLDQFAEYNDAKYRISINGLDRWNL